MPTITSAERDRRLNLAQTVADEGGDMVELGKRLKMPRTNIHNWLILNDVDLVETLMTNSREVKRIRALARLLLLRVAMEFRGGQARLADALGISREALNHFKRTWALDGVDKAIADLWPDDDPPEFLPLSSHGRRQKKTPADGVGRG